MNRGDAAGTRVDISLMNRAVTTWTFRRAEPRRRRCCDVDIPWRQVETGGDAATGKNSLETAARPQARRASPDLKPPRPPWADEADVVKHTVEILGAAAERALKAVDLANALRSRVGVGALSRARLRRLVFRKSRGDRVAAASRAPSRIVRGVASRRRRG